MWNMWNEHGLKLQHLATKVRLIKKLVRIHTKSASVPGPAVFLQRSVASVKTGFSMDESNEFE